MAEADVREAMLDTDDDRVQLEAYLCDDDSRRTVEQLISDLRMRQARVHKGGVAAAVKRLGEHRSPRVLVVDLSNSDLPMSDIDALADACEPGVTVIAVGERNDVGLFRDLMNFGVSDYLVKPLSPPLLQKAISKSTGAAASGAAASAPSHKIASLYTFVGVRGGVGATSIATSFAWSIAQIRRRRVALLDLDLQFGSVSLALDLEPSGALRNALEPGNTSDGMFLDRAMVQHSDRLFVLGGEEKLDEPIEADVDALHSLLSEMRSRFHYVVIDAPRSFDQITHHVLQQSTNVVLVTDLSLAALRDTIRLTSVLPNLNADCQIKLVANRVGDRKTAELSLREFEQGADRKVDFVVPSDPKAATKAATDGMPIAAAKGSASDAMRELAAYLWGERKSTAEEPSLLKKFLPRKG